MQSFPSRGFRGRRVRARRSGGGAAQQRECAQFGAGRVREQRRQRARGALQSRQCARLQPHCRRQRSHRGSLFRPPGAILRSLGRQLDYACWADRPGLSLRRAQRDRRLQPPQARRAAGAEHGGDRQHVRGHSSSTSTGAFRSPTVSASAAGSATSSSSSLMAAHRTIGRPRSWRAGGPPTRSRSSPSGAATTSPARAAEDRLHQRFLPPARNRAPAFVRPGWADNDSHWTNYGVLGTANLGAWAVRAGLFRSSADYPTNYTDLLLNTDRDGVGDRYILAEPDQRFRSISGELRLSRLVEEGALHHLFYLTARGREQRRLYGGGQQLAFGRTDLEQDFNPPRPDFSFGSQSRDLVRQAALGVGYHGLWSGVGELSLGLQKSWYRKSGGDAGGADPPVGRPAVADERHAFGLCEPRARLLRRLRPRARGEPDRAAQRRQSRRGATRDHHAADRRRLSPHSALPSTPGRGPVRRAKALFRPRQPPGLPKISASAAIRASSLAVAAGRSRS